MRARSTIVALTTIGLLVLVEMGLSEARAMEALEVTVSIVPQQYFVERIGGGLVQVSVMVLPGASPAVYEPKPQQMVALTKSRLYFAMGVPFERVWLKKFAKINSSMKIVHTEEGIERMPMKGLHQEAGEGHGRGIMDPHVWLSPPLVMIQARNILDALTKADPVHKQEYAKNYKSFIENLVDLDLEIRSIFHDAAEGHKFMVYHPSWGYFAKAYGLTQIPIEIEGKEPTPKALENLIQYARKEGVKVVFVQPQFSSKSAKIIADALSADVTVADPLARRWKENLLKVAEVFRRASQ